MTNTTPNPIPVLWISRKQFRQDFTDVVESGTDIICERAVSNDANGHAETEFEKMAVSAHTPVHQVFRVASGTIGKESITPCSRRHPHSSEAWALASESGCIISPRPFRESLKLPSSPEVSQKREVTSRRVISYLKQPSLDVMPTHCSASAEVASIPRRATLLDLLCHLLQSLGYLPLHPPEVWRSPPRAVGTTAPLVLHAA